MKLYKLAFIYSSFNTGYSLTAPIKWLAAVVGLGNSMKGGSLWWIIGGGGVYFIICIIVGAICYKGGWVDATAEVSNKYNPLAKQLRKKLEMEQNI